MARLQIVSERKKGVPVCIVRPLGDYWRLTFATDARDVRQKYSDFISGMQSALNRLEALGHFVPGGVMGDSLCFRLDGVKY